MPSPDIDNAPEKHSGGRMAEVSTITIADQKRAIENWAKLWSAHDMQRLPHTLPGAAAYEAGTMGAVNRGAAAITTFGEGFLAGFPDVTFELQSSFANG